MIRTPGDHGSALDAIDYALDHEPDGDAATFLRRWREGDLSEWPEFYEWLAKREQARGNPYDAIHRGQLMRPSITGRTSISGEEEPPPASSRAASTGLSRAEHHGP